jgi:hypothetical protein
LGRHPDRGRLSHRPRHADRRIPHLQPALPTRLLQRGLQHRTRPIRGPPRRWASTAPARSTA